ncbi:hypothetical protein [Chryseobacterium sp.]|uniref:hypothetical protein n=1 Tax=Chryseobacterium sp. TaxID=1871047 RepID=UPI002899DE8B|nr:hypothetical protein [Chryseobacterium sp.]
MMKNLIILLILFVACNQNKSQDLQLIALSPKTYEFKAGENRNRIDYFYLEGQFSYNVEEYEKLKQKIDEKTAAVNTKSYHLYSVYIYKETNVINKDYKGEREAFDGHNEDLIAYVRYTDGKMDIFYMIEKANVVYDAVSGKEENFEFDQ